MLNENNLYLLTNEKQRLYLTGFLATDGYVVVSDGKKFLFVEVFLRRSKSIEKFRRYGRERL